jgi:putative ABC transport system permease protein
VMRMIGVRRRTVFAALLLEACLVALVGAALGIGLAWASSEMINAYYGARFETDLRFAFLTPEIMLFGTLLSVVLGVLAGGAAAARLIRTSPLVLWRRG